MIVIPAPHPGVTDSRVAAADILADLREGTLLDAAFDRRTAGLDARDRRWTQELVYGLLRRREFLDSALHPRVRGGIARLHADLTDLLRTRCLPAAVHEQRPAVRGHRADRRAGEDPARHRGQQAGERRPASHRSRARGTRAGRSPSDPTDIAGELARQHSHPRWLVERWVKQFGASATATPARSETTKRLVWCCGRGVSSASSSRRRSNGAACPRTRCRWSPTASSCRKARRCSSWPPWRQGHCFVQDPAATLVTRYASFPAGATVADLCAAPGGKTLELSRTAEFVVAADRSLARLERLTANLHRLEAHNIGLMASDATAPAVIAPGRCPDRRPVHRHRHLPPSSGCAVAPSRFRPRFARGVAG